MATIEIVGDDVVLKLSRVEALEAMHMHTAVTAPVAAVQSVASVDDPWPLRGIKEEGTEVPGEIMVGTKRGEGFKDFCDVHKHAPAVIVTFDPELSKYNRWVFTGDIDDVPAALMH